MKRKYWTIDECLLLEKLTKQGSMSFDEMTKCFAMRSRKSLIGQCYKMKLTNSFAHRKYTYNEQYWKTLTSQSAYYAGFVAADGCIMKRGGERDSYRFAVGIAEKDLMLLQDFKKDLNYSGPILKSDKGQTLNTANGKSYVCQPTHRLSMQVSNGWAKDLKYYWNIEPNKTNRLGPPNIHSQYLNLCYLIGFIDGDGCLAVDSEGKCMRFVFSSSSYQILNWIKEITDKYINIGVRMRPRIVHSYTGKKNYSEFSIGGKPALDLYCLLNSLSVQKLDRKWNNPKVLSFIEKFKLEKPDIYQKILQNAENVKTKLSQIPNPV